MAKFKSFPRTKDKVGSTYAIDYDRLKEIYLDGPDYNWTPFCDRHKFNGPQGKVNFKKSGVDFSSWKIEWLKKQAHLQDEEIGPEFLDLRKLVAVQRIRHVKDWVDRAKYMKILLDAMLKIHGEALTHDMNKTLEIQAGRTQKKFLLQADELSQLAACAGRIQEIETRALLLTGDKMNHPRIGAEGAVDHGDGTVDNRTPELEVATMGAAGMSAAETAKLLAQWFDQAEKPKDLPAPNGHINGTNGTNGLHGKDTDAASEDQG